jgi:hypothetical protein
MYYVNHRTWRNVEKRFSPGLEPFEARLKTLRRAHLRLSDLGWPNRRRVRRSRWSVLQLDQRSAEHDPRVAGERWSPRTGITDEPDM